MDNWSATRGEAYSEQARLLREANQIEQCKQVILSFAEEMVSGTWPAWEEHDDDEQLERETLFTYGLMIFRLAGKLWPTRRYV